MPDWSVVDLVFHCGKYAELTGSISRRWRRAPFVDVEQPEHEWQAMNDGWAAESKTLTWEQAVAAAEAGRMKARTALEALGEVDDAAAHVVHRRDVRALSRSTPRRSRGSPTVAA